MWLRILSFHCFENPSKTRHFKTPHLHPDIYLPDSWSTDSACYSLIRGGSIYAHITLQEYSSWYILRSLNPRGVHLITSFMFILVPWSSISRSFYSSSIHPSILTIICRLDVHVSTTSLAKNKIDLHLDLYLIGMKIGSILTGVHHVLISFVKF